MPRSATSDRRQQGRAVARDRRPRGRARHARAQPRERKTKALPRRAAGGSAPRPTRTSRCPVTALVIDDRRWVRASLRDRVRVLIVDGDPRTVRHDDEVFYLEAALRPGDREDSGTSVRVITVEELAGVEPRARGTAGAIDLDGSNVVILANVAALSDPAGQRPGRLGARRRRHPGRPRRSRRSGGVRHTMLPLLPRACRDPIDTRGAPAPDERRQPRAPPGQVGGRPFRNLPAVLQGRTQLADGQGSSRSRCSAPRRSADRKVLARFTERRRRAGVRPRFRRRPQRFLFYRRTSIATGTPADPPRVPAADASRRSATWPASTRVRRHRSPVGSQSCCRPAISRRLEVAPRRRRRGVRGRPPRRPIERPVGPHRSPGRVPRHRHRSDRLDHDRDELAFVVTSTRAARTDPGAGERTAAVGHRRRAPRPTPRAASSCGHALAAAVLLLLLAEGVSGPALTAQAQRRAADRSGRGSRHAAWRSPHSELVRRVPLSSGVHRHVAISLLISHVLARCGADLQIRRTHRRIQRWPI